MIINKQTHAYITMADKPCENWTTQDCFVLDDNNELAKRIMQHYPNIELVIEDDKITDVKVLEAPKEDEPQPITVEERLSALESAVLELALGGAEL